jgi:peptidoglycan/xylan/chitin deacetylase (PgdA/CDA1 family)
VHRVSATVKRAVPVYCSKVKLPPLALAYHGLFEMPLRDDPHHFFVRPSDLKAQIRRLRAWGYSLVTFGELVRRTRLGEATGAAVLTFDDGLVDVVETLLPVLESEGAVATVFVVSGWLGKPHPDAPSRRIINEDELRRLAGSEAVEIGAHTVTHPNLCTLPYEGAVQELRGSKEALERIGGTAVEVAAYPYGAANAETRRACREVGFTGACRTSGEGSWSDPYDLPRQTMENRASLLGLRLKRAGRYEQLMRHKAFRLVRKTSRRLHELREQ